MTVAGPLAALIINAQRRELDGRVKELDELVIGQQQATRALRGENAQLQQTLNAQRASAPRADGNLLQWRRNLIADIVRRHYAAAVAPPDHDALDLKSRAQIQLGVGMMLAAANRTENAIEQFAGAQAALEQLAELQPANHRLQAALAECCEQLADLRRAAGQPQAAEQAASRALEIRRRLADSRPGDAAAQIDLLTAHYAFPQVATALKAIPQQSERVIDQWPRDAAAIYEAACRLTFKTPVLSDPPPDPTPAP